jgi:hypothetical protein
MKRAATLKLIAPLCLLGLLIGARVSGQQQAKVEHPKQVTQGSDIVFKITTDKPANIEGSVGVVVVSADGSQLSSSNNSNLGTGQTGQAVVRIPLDAKTGKWKVVKVLFFAAGGGINKDLTPNGDLTFEVTAHEPLVLPSQANVEIR